MAYYLSEINARCRADAAGFIAECDRVYADRLELAADRIMENMEKSPIVRQRQDDDRAEDLRGA